MTIEEIEEIQRPLYEQISRIRRDAELMCEPLIQRLIYLEGLKPPRPVLIETSILEAGMVKLVNTSDLKSGD